jgi:hypothetical protein
MYTDACEPVSGGGVVVEPLPQAVIPKTSVNAMATAIIAAALTGCFKILLFFIEKLLFVLFSSY